MTKSISEESKKILKKVYSTKFPVSIYSPGEFVDFVEMEFNKGICAESSTSKLNTFENYFGKETHYKSKRLKVSYEPAKHLVLEEFVEKVNKLMKNNDNQNNPFRIYFSLTR